MFSPQVRLNLGMYIIFLLDWLTVFHREQILVLRLEDYAANLKVTIKKVFDFLSVGTYLKSASIFLAVYLCGYFCVRPSLLSSLQVLCRSRWRQLWPNDPCLTPDGPQTGTLVLCAQLPETSSGNFTSPSTINWPVCWTIRLFSGVTPEGHNVDLCELTTRARS